MCPSPVQHFLWRTSWELKSLVVPRFLGLPGRRFGSSQLIGNLAHVADCRKKTVKCRFQQKVYTIDFQMHTHGIGVALFSGL